MRQVRIWLAVILFCSLFSAQGQDEPKRGPSTPEERKRFMTLVQKLQQTPLDKSLWPEVTWARQWLEDVPDINVSMCPAPLGSFALERYKYQGLISVEFAFAMAAYLIQHSNKAADNQAQYKAGVEGALKAYRAILKSQPDAKSKGLDELISKESDGSLDDFVREATQACGDTNKA